MISLITPWKSGLAIDNSIWQTPETVGSWNVCEPSQVSLRLPSDASCYCGWTDGLRQLPRHAQGTCTRSIPIAQQRGAQQNVDKQCRIGGRKGMIWPQLKKSYKFKLSSSQEELPDQDESLQTRCFSTCTHMPRALLLSGAALLLASCS